MYALLEFGDQGAMLLVGGLILLEHGEQYVDEWGAFLRWDAGQWGNRAENRLGAGHRQSRSGLSQLAAEMRGERIQPHRFHGYV